MPVLAHRVAHDADEVLGHELDRRDVDGNEAVVGQMAGVAAGLAQHPFADRPDHAGFLGDRDELHRRDHAAFRMVPADQRFVADDAAGRKIELRLVVKIEVTALEGDVQLGFDPLAMVGDPAHFGMEDRPVAHAAGARILQRQIGAAQDEDGIDAILGHRHDAHRQADRLQVRAELVGFHHLVDELLDHAFKRPLNLADR